MRGNSSRHSRPLSGQRPGSAKTTMRGVQLNVGGTVFTTQYSTLVKDPRSLFAKRLWGTASGDNDAEGRMFFDRDPVMFQLLLRFLEGDERGAMRSLSSAEDVEAALDEAQFFQLDKVAESLELRLADLSTQTLLVGDGCAFSTINDAINAAEPGQRIMVHDGVYNESLRITRPIQLLARNKPQQGKLPNVAIHVAGEPAVTVSSAGVVIEGLALRRMGTSDPDRHAAAVSLWGGETKAERGRRHDARGPTVDVVSGGAATIRASHIIAGMGDGCCVYEGGVLHLDRCVIPSASRTAIATRGATQLTRVKITEPGAMGVLVDGQGSASIVRCDIQSPKDAGCAVQGGRLELLGSTIRDTGGPGLAASNTEQDGVTVRNCTFTMCGRSGIAAVANASVRIVGTQLKDCVVAGVVCGDGSSINVQSCALQSAAGPGILFSMGEGQVIRTEIHDCLGAGIVIDESENVRIRDTTVKGSKDVGVFIRSSSTIIKSMVIEDCRLAGMHIQHGIMDEDQIDSRQSMWQARPSSWDVEPKEVEVEARRQRIMQLNTAPKFKIEVVSTSVTRCTDGVTVEGVIGPSLSEMLIHGVRRHGLRIARDACPVFLSTEVRGATGCGILCERGGKGVFRSGLVTQCRASGVYVSDDGSGIAIRGSQITGNEGPGLYYSQGCGGEAMETTVQGNSTSGIVIKSKAQPLLQDCVVENNVGTGLLVTEGGHGRIESCTFRDNNLVAVQISLGGKPRIFACCIEGGKQGGVIAAEGSWGDLQCCEVSKCGQVGVVLGAESNLRVSECKVFSVSQFGIMCLPGCFGSIEFCKVYDCGKAAIATVADANPAMLDNTVQAGPEGGLAQYGSKETANSNKQEGKKESEDKQSEGESEAPPLAEEKEQPVASPKQDRSPSPEQEPEKPVMPPKPPAEPKPAPTKKPSRPRSSVSKGSTSAAGLPVPE